MQNSNSKDGTEVPQSTNAGVPTSSQTITKSLVVGSTVINESCPEFPFFGATYPDATCIDGYLWDLDKCTDDGGLYGGGEEPCPFCNTKVFVRQNTDSLNGVTRKKLFSFVEKLREKYG